MATPSETPPTIVPAPIATADQHVCFICLQTDADTPNAKFVNPCPCSLEAHETCMLRFVAEMETQKSRNKNYMRCPACRAPIHIDEPFDPVVAFRNRLQRTYNRTSPWILLLMVSFSGLSASTFYGANAFSLFAGYKALGQWMGERGLGRAHITAPSSILKLWPLSIIGPTLILTRGIPSLAHAVFVPASALYSLTLIAGSEVLSWPSSFNWAMAIMPVLHLSYFQLYYEFFGSFEKRLNRALRGRPPVEEVAAGDEAPGAAGAPAAPAADEEEPGLWSSIFGLGRAALGLFLDNPVEGGLEVEIGIGGGHEGDEDDDNDVANDDDLADEDFHILADQGAARQGGEQDQPALPLPQQQPPPAQQQQPPAPPQQENQNQNQGRNRNAQVEEYRTWTLLTDIINNIVTSLLFPAISAGMGEVIFRTAPKAWVTRSNWRAPPRLLQEKWGRSLVGGCLFVVLKDAFSLYAKYRRVQVKLNRKIRNVERRTVQRAG
ncbi:hypothetical protein B0H63DRAFT_507921 [Podospora didyma]|uniref:RING-type domain-containing protein n=1 Tax=Podospora didyma TaxID=330526 RepID=A0AAE0NZQ9_9PEZI|nr:hypothetical protein B0H63DRAFT_507921 [Podospora didyma]